MDHSSKILSDIVVCTKYALFREDLGRRETWSEVVDRNKQMHLKKFAKVDVLDLIEEAYPFVYDYKVLPSMRSAQFAGKPMEISPVRGYNCSYAPIDAPEAFSEVMFLLLSGCGVGYSVQRHHVESLPEIRKTKRTKRFLIGDSIEGWADSVKVLIGHYFRGKSKPVFDYSDIRQKGVLLKTSGGRAPGPEPLRECLFNIEKVLERKSNGDKLTTLEAHDILCHIADAVLAGGIRRAAMIALFSFDDHDMIESKFGKWYELNPQRARANNSAVILRHKISKEEFFEFWDKMRYSDSGDPGFMMSNDQNWGMNPCAEVSLRPFQFCNLTSVNVSDVSSQEELEARVRAASIVGTLQASYTDFHYLREAWKTTTEKEALIGVSMTGIASGGVMKLDLKKASEIVKKTNAEVAKRLGIRPAARCTVIKPEGTSSLVLGTSSGIHSWHSKYYIRRMRVLKNEPIYQYLAKELPELVEDDYFKPRDQAVIAVPIRAPQGAITREEPALDLLDRVEKVYAQWIVGGHRKGHNHNNVSCTVTVKTDEWDNVRDWMWDNREKYTALSVFPYVEYDQPQLPFEEITKSKYDSMSKAAHEIDLTKVLEYEDNTNRQGELACAGGACEIV